MKHYATFGVGKPLAGCYFEFDETVPVTAVIEWLNEAFGSKWGFIYNESAFEGQAERYNLHLLGTFAVGRDGHVRIKRTS